MNETEQDRRWMRAAIEICAQGIRKGQTPFAPASCGADQLVAASHNEVVLTTDITAHAEVTAIRAACRALSTIDLGGCTIYSTCEPCPMCFGACHWANLDRIVYGTQIADAAGCGFRELPLSNEEMRRLGGSRIQIMGGCLREESVQLFRAWKQRPDRRAY